MFFCRGSRLLLFLLQMVLVPCVLIHLVLLILTVERALHMHVFLHKFHLIHPADELF